MNSNCELGITLYFVSDKAHGNEGEVEVRPCVIIKPVRDEDSNRVSPDYSQITVALDGEERTICRGWLFDTEYDAWKDLEQFERRVYDELRAKIEQVNEDFKQSSLKLNKYLRKTFALEPFAHVGK